MNKKNWWMMGLGIAFTIVAGIHLGGFTGFAVKSQYKNFDFNFFKNLILFSLSMSLAVWSFYVAYRKR